LRWSVLGGAVATAWWISGAGGQTTDVAQPAARAAATPNQIVRENALPGTTAWLSTPTVPQGTIEGYAEPSVERGGVARFHLAASSPVRYRLRVYRLGWYDGLGARELLCLPSCTSDEAAARRVVPAPDANGMVKAGWPVTDTLPIPADWVSGYYMAQYLVTSGPAAGQAARTFFVVRDPPTATSRLLVQVPVNTWQAYNGWGGMSLYDISNAERKRANRVSFERPYNSTIPGAQESLAWELPLVRFLERAGYDVSYQTDLDTSLDPASLMRHRLVVTAGHDEYWSKEMRDAFTVARDNGTNLAFMGANTAYWQVRYEDAGRTMVSYKSLYDPEPNTTLKTAMFRELTPPRYECELMGIQHQGVRLNWPAGDYEVQAAALNDPWLAGTGFNTGSTIRGVVSIETDTIPGNQTAQSSCSHTLTVFFHRELGSDKDGNADAIRYVATSGARVFSSGSHQFAWSLEEPGTDPRVQHGLVDPRLQAFMRNALADLQRPAPPARVVARRRPSNVRIAVTRSVDPRITAIVVKRLTNSGGRTRSTVICRTSATACIDRPPTRAALRYAAVTVDAWGSSTQALSEPLHP
jgi:hypothetical protein